MLVGASKEKVPDNHPPKSSISAQTRALRRGQYWLATNIVGTHLTPSD
jgi:hypothetical protein